MTGNSNIPILYRFSFNKTPMSFVPKSILMSGLVFLNNLFL